MPRKAILFCWVLWNTALAYDSSASLQRLLAGHQRYIKDEPLHADHSADRRKEVAVKQKPFATILGCSDSRVTPEVIFDQGMGELFVVRVAGNVVGPTELDSIDYSVRHLGSSLVLVLGHEACGAVTAVMKGDTADIQDLANLIRPGIQGTRDVAEAVKANVRWMLASLQKSPLLKQLIAEKKIECIGAYYHLGSGRLEILKPEN